MSDPITRLNAALGGRYTIEPELGEGGVSHEKVAEAHPWYRWHGLECIGLTETIVAKAEQRQEFLEEWAAQNTAIGFNGEPVPPGIASGANIRRNSHRPLSAAASPSASRSQLSSMWIPR